MPSLNQVTLLGNLTRDPQVKYTAGGTAVCELGLAINESYFDRTTNSKKESTVFCDVVCWGRTAEVAGEYLQKGRPVLVTGRLKTDSWDDRESGKKRSKLTVVCENLQMLSGKPDSSAESRPNRQEEESRRDQQPQSQGNPDYGSGDAPQDEVPF